MLQVFSYMHFQVLATYVLVVRCLNVLYKFDNSGESVPISIWCLYNISLSCYLVIVSASLSVIQ